MIYKRTVNETSIMRPSHQAKAATFRPHHDHKESYPKCLDFSKEI